MQKNGIKIIIGVACAAMAVAAKGDLRLVDVGGAWGIDGVPPDDSSLPGAPYNPPEAQVYKNRIGDNKWVDDATGAVVAVYHAGESTSDSGGAVAQEFLYEFGLDRRFRYEELGTTYCILVSQRYFTAGGTGSGIHYYQHTCETLNPTPRPESCEMGPTALIEMGSVPKSEFTGVGSGGREVEAAVPFTCSGPTNVKVSVTGVVDPNRGGGLLKLTDGGAEGIGFQLRLNGREIPVNGDGIILTGVEGANVFQLSAQYVQTKEGVSAGAANASATVNVQVP